VETFIALIGKSLFTSLTMFWEVFWPLALGFMLSAVIQAVVSKEAIARRLGCDEARCYGWGALFGAASSSCSYAAVALARSLFRKGASFTSSMIFEIASTNLVIELGLALVIILGWQFMAAEILGGIIIIAIVALIFRRILNSHLIDEAKQQASKNIAGQMEGHAAMDMSVHGGTFWSRLASPRGFTAVSHFFVMDWLSVWTDVLIGFILAGILATFVPESFWQSLFLTGNSSLAFLVGPLIGPIVAMLSFVCSVGNVPLAAVLWRGGISFGGVISFIFADLLILPILNIYRKYYGKKMTLIILGTFFAAMVLAGYIVELVFSAARIIPTNRNIFVFTAGISWNYTSWLNIFFFALSAIFIWRFLKTGGPAMMRMMEKPPASDQEHHHCDHCE
jgi:uncharacterized protein